MQAGYHARTRKGHTTYHVERYYEKCGDHGRKRAKEATQYSRVLQDWVSKIMMLPDLLCRVVISGKLENFRGRHSCYEDSGSCIEGHEAAATPHIAHNLENRSWDRSAGLALLNKSHSSERKHH